MLNITVIMSQQSHYNKAFFSKLAKKRQKNIFLKKENTFFELNRFSLVINDGLNIVIKTFTCSTLLYLSLNIRIK